MLSSAARALALIDMVPLLPVHSFALHWDTPAIVSALLPSSFRLIDIDTVQFESRLESGGKGPDELITRVVCLDAIGDPCTTLECEDFTVTVEPIQPAHLTRISVSQQAPGVFEVVYVAISGDARFATVTISLPPRFGNFYVTHPLQVRCFVYSRLLAYCLPTL